MANFGDIPSNIVLGSGESVRRNAANDAFEAYTPSAYTFQHSLVEAAGVVNLVNDSASPGNSKYYGTNGSGTRGFYDIPSSMVYPGAGIAVSTGSAWGTSITDNSANWNTAHGWGNHASAGYLTTLPNHNLIDTTHHPVSGLTTGHYIRATGATTYAFAAIAIGDLPTITVAKGGLNKTSAAQGDILYASSTTAYAALTKSTTANQYLKNSGTSNNPAWATIAYSDISGTPTIPTIGGSDTHVQYNSSGAFAGSSKFVWNNTTGVLTLNNKIQSPDDTDLIIKAGDKNVGTVGKLYLSPGTEAGFNPNIFFGDPTYDKAGITLSPAGTQTDISLNISPKGYGGMSIGGPLGDTLVYGNVFGLMSANVQVGYSSLGTVTFAGGAGTSVDVHGTNVVFKGGNAWSTGNNNGGSLYLHGGDPNGSGLRGDVYFGDGSNGYLPAKSAETNVVYYDTTTGKLSYGTVSGGSSTFLALTDTPSSYSGQAGSFLRVNSTPNALEFLTAAQLLTAIGGLPVFASSAAINANTIIQASSETNYSGKMVLVNGTYTITLNSDTTTGFQCTIIRNASGDVTFVAGGGVTIKSASNYLKIRSQNEGVTVYKYDSTTYFLFGALKA